MNEKLRPGLSGIATAKATAGNTAQALGSGSVAVYATPALVALIEQAAVNALTDVLHAGSTSVGVRIDVRHTAATPVGMAVIATATLVEVDGRRLRFDVSARDDVESIAAGEHERAIVDEQRFLARVAAKSGDA